VEGRTLTRTGLLAAGARRGVVVLAAGTAFGALAGTAAADPISDNDLAYARLLVGAELLTIDFYGRALAAQRHGRVGRKYMRVALADENAHYHSVAAILTGAGLPAATADDFDFAYPSGSFASRGSIARLGRRLETLVLGAYLGAVGGFQTQSLVQPLSRVAASEAQHLSLWGLQLGGHPSSVAFPAPLTIDQASNAMDAYTA
jgi:hypothetical protein